MIRWLNWDTELRIHKNRGRIKHLVRRALLSIESLWFGFFFNFFYLSSSCSNWYSIIIIVCIVEFLVMKRKKKNQLKWKRSKWQDGWAAMMDFDFDFYLILFELRNVHKKSRSCIIRVAGERFFIRLEFRFDCFFFASCELMGSCRIRITRTNF